jgi:hypothetical protein
MEVYPMDPTVKHVLDQSFANTHQMFSSAAAQFTTVAGFINQQAQYNFLHGSQLVGATAAGNLQKGHLSGDILAQRSAAGQPQLDPNKA